MHEENKYQCTVTHKKTPTLHQNCTQILLYLPECNRKRLPRIQCQNMWGHLDCQTRSRNAELSQMLPERTKYPTVWQFCHYTSNIADRKEWRTTSVSWFKSEQAELDVNFKLTLFNHANKIGNCNAAGNFRVLQTNIWKSRQQTQKLINRHSVWKCFNGPMHDCFQE